MVTYEKLIRRSVRFPQLHVIFQLGSWWAGDSPDSRTIQLENTTEVQHWSDQNQTYTFPLKGRTIKVVTIIVSFSCCYSHCKLQLDCNYDYIFVESQ